MAEEWPTVPLDGVVRFQEGPGILAKDFRPDGVPLVRLAGLGGYEVTLEKCNFLDPSLVEKKWKHFRLRRGDILISTSASFGRPAVVGDLADGAVFYTGLIRFRSASEELDEGYLKAFLGSRSFMLQAEAQASGSVISHFGPSHLRRMFIPLPPLDTQRLIAATQAALDDKIELNRRMNQTLEAMAQAVFRDWFVDFGPVRRKLAGATDPVEIMGGLVADRERAAELAGSQPAALGDEERPVGWRVRPLSELTTELRRGIGPKYLEQGGVLVLNQKCIRNREVSFGPARRHDDNAKGVAGRTIVNGDVLVNSTGVGTLGRIAQIWGLDQRVIVDSHVTVVRASSTDLSAIYLGLALGLREEEIVALGEGSTGQTELSREQLGRMEMTVPSKAVLDQFDAICTPLVERIQANRREAATLAEIRNYLLPRLMSGEVKVADMVQEVAA